ncbi:MAG TPA: hypothetical protein VGO84_10015 [Burkholderiales bacterium]|nr:hypothetical protein [Burkholderiales bacterium]
MVLKFIVVSKLIARSFMFLAYEDAQSNFNLARGEATKVTKRWQLAFYAARPAMTQSGNAQQVTPGEQSPRRHPACKLLAARFDAGAGIPL